MIFIFLYYVGSYGLIFKVYSKNDRMLTLFILYFHNLGLLFVVRESYGMSGVGKGMWFTYLILMWIHLKLDFDVVIKHAQV